LGGQSLNDSITASTAFSKDLWSECNTINTEIFNAARSDNTFSTLLDWSSASLQNDIN